ncbi:hypothetical protein LOD99_2497 [Oopsacas minuta]|uniref:Fibronectin type-III domain-containing protein n=1 Tax=Oopsacas minuta TaxID=111878 RepID=A0AAV7K3C9_9METZ|nr:hypothetical protein LOD99_2497 [Oopsacas minuta]
MIGNCLGDSITADTQLFSLPSQPDAYTCSAKYGSENRILVLQLFGYTSEYAIETSFTLSEDSDNTINLSDTFTEPRYYSKQMFNLPSTRNYTVMFTSILRDCIRSLQTTCETKLNITARVTPNPSPPPLTNTFVTTSPSTSFPMNNLLLLLLLLSLLLCYMRVSCEFIPPSNQICMDESITFDCLLPGTFPTIQLFVINNTTVNLFQINNIDSFFGIDLTRLSATVDNALDQNTGLYTVLRANITLVNITKGDNGTLIGCTATTSGNVLLEDSDTLYLASPPSEPDIILSPIPSNCSVKVSWTYPIQSTLPITEEITDSVTNIITYDRVYFSNFLTAGQDYTYTLTSSNCLGDSITADTQLFSLPSQPDAYTCSAEYGSENRMLVLQLLGYTSEYAIETSFTLSEDSDNTTNLSDTFTEPRYYSKQMFDLPSTRNYTVVFTSVLRDCIGSLQTTCEAKLIITGIVTPTSPPIPTPTPSMTIPTQSPQDYLVYIIIAVVLFLLLLFLSFVIILLTCLLNRGKIFRNRTSPQNAKGFSKRVAAPAKISDSNENGDELNYLKPEFGSNPKKPNAPIPKTLYADIKHMPSDYATLQ